MTQTPRTLGTFGIKAVEDRGLSCETAARLGVYTGSHDEVTGQVVPNEFGKIIVFPFEERGVTVAEKYRAAGKKFWQRAGGRRTFWNSDALDDPALAEGRMALVITEGEFDAIAAIECGFPLTVSVPDGAPGVPKGQKPETLQPIDERQEPEGKFEFLWNNRDRLKLIRRFILAVDNDDPGKRLAAELVRRLSASRCLFVTYPPGCKDLNDVLQKHGPEEVTAVLNSAQPYPVHGVFSLHDYPDKPQIQTFSTGWEQVDTLMRVFMPSLTVVTGVPGHGKSTWLANLVCNLVELHGFKAAIFSPEMPVVPHLRDKLRRIGGKATIEQLARERRIDGIDRWIGEHFAFIDHNTQDDEDISLEWILERAADAVLRHDIRVLTLDPWNEIEHTKRRDETMSDYIPRAIRMIKKFAKKYDIAVFLVAHPTKDVGKDGKSRVPTMYDIEGSASWFNKPDLGVIINRPETYSHVTNVFVSKVRFEGTGKKGLVNLKYDVLTSRYGPLDEQPGQQASMIDQMDAG